jgi:hypothetical protein
MRIVFIIFFLFLANTPSPAFAYFGPGVALPVLLLFIGIILVVLFLLLVVFYYPIKKFFKKKK